MLANITTIRKSKLRTKPKRNVILFKNPNPKRTNGRPQETYISESRGDKSRKTANLLGEFIETLALLKNMDKQYVHMYVHWRRMTRCNSDYWIKHQIP